jgi:hypothetical protein
VVRSAVDISAVLLAPRHLPPANDGRRPAPLLVRVGRRLTRQRGAALLEKPRERGGRRSVAPKMENVLYYTASTIAQALAGTLAILIAVALASSSRITDAIQGGATHRVIAMPQGSGSASGRRLDYPSPSLHCASQPCHSRGRSHRSDTLPALCSQSSSCLGSRACSSTGG